MTDTADDGRGGGAADDGRTGVFVAETDAERRDAFAVRRAVFVDEQGVDEAIEYDDHDEPGADATHFVAYDDGAAVGAARLRAADETTAKAERVAVAADRRGEGWGRDIMRTVEGTARTEGFDRLALHAQTRVREFYERLGYDAHGEEFEEAGIPHIEMSIGLDDA
ncbi:GNAT family N-acetyltransferase [Halobellus rubicundus]|uniref:GNAT family N-acetyltransferase n=1 Tax=Halobellus rubicundus TaxID=2996466 RepID=A0ABD5MEU3_9EURY